MLQDLNPRIYDRGNSANHSTITWGLVQMERLPYKIKQFIRYLRKCHLGQMSFSLHCGCVTAKTFQLWLTLVLPLLVTFWEFAVLIPNFLPEIWKDRLHFQNDSRSHYSSSISLWETWCIFCWLKQVHVFRNRATLLKRLEYISLEP